MMRPTQRKRRRTVQWNLFWLAFPFLVIILLFKYVPLFGWAISFFEYKPGYSLFDCKFVGLKFFRMMLTNRDIPRVMTNTLIFSFINLALQPLPMLFAILLNEIEAKHFRKLAQTVTTIPHFISWVIVYSLAFALFANDGLLNQARSVFGMPAVRSVLTDRKAVYWFQTLVSQWKGLGWSAIIYIAAIAGIDGELYEAASVDGASRLGRAIHITIPGLMPTFIVLLLLFISNFINQGFEQYYVFKNSIIYNNIEVLDVLVYRKGLEQADYSFATAMGMLKSLISVTLLFSANAFAKKVRGTSIV